LQKTEAMHEIIQADYQLFINRKGKQLLGPGRIELLYSIQRTGSLRAAAKALQISYQHAWSLIDAINQASSEPIVSKIRGGNGGGGASITSYGEKLLIDYRLLIKKPRDFSKN
jgi:molybdate transport system regulatory protein